MRKKFADLFKKTIALVLVFAMVFCSNSFNNLSIAYAEGVSEDGTSIFSENAENSEPNVVEPSEVDKDEENSTAASNSSDSDEKDENETDAPKDETENIDGIESDSTEASDEIKSTENESDSNEYKTTNETTDEITNESNDEVATESEVEEITTESEVEEVATESEVEEVVKTATDNEIDSNLVSSESEVKLDYDKLDAFSQITFYDNDAAEIDGDVIKLLKDIELKDTISFKDGKSLDLSGHTILGPEDSYALYVENNFTLYNESETVGKIEGRSKTKPTIYIKNANVELAGGSILGASANSKVENKLDKNGGNAIELLDSDIKFTGALVYGGNGLESDDGKGGNGGDAVVVLSSTKTNKISIDAGALYGGNGANGKGEVRPNPGSALRVLNKNYESEYFGEGLPGNIGGGSGGVALNIKSDSFKSENLTYENYTLNAGHAGYSKVIALNEELISKNLENNVDDSKLAKKRAFESVYGSAEDDSYYSLHDLNDKNYLTSLKNQLQTDLCTAFATTAYAETSLIKNYPDYVRDVLNKNVDATLDQSTWNNNADEINLSEMQLAMAWRVQPKDEFGNAGSSNNISNYSWASRGFSEYAIANAITTWRSLVEEDDVLKWSNISGNSNLVGRAINRNTLNSYNDKIVVTTNNARTVMSSEFWNGTTFDRDSYVRAMKESIVNNSGSLLCVFTCEDRNHYLGNYIKNGVNYGTNLNIITSPDSYNGNSLGGHCMYAIGWDDDIEFDVTHKPNAYSSADNYTEHCVGAFICKNSWNEFSFVPYANNFIIYRENGTDGTTPYKFTSFISMNFVPSYSKDENIYYYDTGLGNVYEKVDAYRMLLQSPSTGNYYHVRPQDNVAYGVKIAYRSIANAFKIRNNKEKVRGVSFYLHENEDLRVSLYKTTSVSDALVIGNNIKNSSNLLYTRIVSGKCGYNYIEVPDDINLNKDDCVAVVVGSTTDEPLKIKVLEDTNVDEYSTTYVNKSFFLDLVPSIYVLAVPNGSTYTEYEAGTNEYNANYNLQYATKVLDAYKASNLWRDVKVDKGNLRIRLVTNNYVKLNANGQGNYDGSESTYYYPNLKEALTNMPYPSSIPSNKIFVKYNTKFDKSGSDYTKDSIYNIGVAKQLELYAIYDDIFTLTFDANGGTGSMEPLTGRYGEVTTPVHIPNCQFAKPGFAFNGWIDENKNVVDVDKDLTLTSNKTIKATWKENEYAINYVLNDGELSGDYAKVRKYTEDVDLPKLEQMSRDGYVFDGWYDNKDFTGKIFERSDVANSDKVLTYYAKWSVKKSGGGKAPSGGGGGSSGGGGGGAQLPTQAANTPAANTPTATSDTKLTTSMTSVSVNYVNTASAWTADASGNWHLNVANATGEVVEAKNTFVCLPQEVVNTTGQKTTILDFYYFDANGNMYTGWLRDANNTTYYFDKTVGSNQGKLTRGWANIDGGYYFFDANGVLMTNGVTPDGYVVDANGKWLQ